MEQVRDALLRYADAGADEFIVPDFHLDSADETIELMDILTAELG